MFLKFSQLCIKNFEKVESEEEERQGGRWGGLRGPRSPAAEPPFPPKIFCYLKIGESTHWEAQDGPERGAVLPVSI